MPEKTVLIAVFTPYKPFSTVGRKASSRTHGKTGMMMLYQISMPANSSGHENQTLMFSCQYPKQLSQSGRLGKKLMAKNHGTCKSNS